MFVLRRRAERYRQVSPQRSSLVPIAAPDDNAMYLQLFLHKYTTTGMGCAVNGSIRAVFTVHRSAPRPVEVTTDYLRVLDKLLPACHVMEQYANNAIEPDHG